MCVKEVLRVLSEKKKDPDSTSEERKRKTVSGSGSYPYLHWRSHVLQCTRNTRSCITGHPVWYKMQVVMDCFKGSVHDFFLQNLTVEILKNLLTNPLRKPWGRANTLQKIYSILKTPFICWMWMQCDAIRWNIFGGNVVLDRFNKASRDEDILYDQMYKSLDMIVFLLWWF